MKTNWNETPQRFRPGKLEPLKWRPAPGAAGPEHAVPFARSQENPLELLKRRLLKEALGATPEPALLVPVRRAANEAAALAWLEPFPLLVFPQLFAEKVLVADNRARQQSRIRRRTARLMEVFA